MNIYKTIRNIEDLADLQLEVDIELMKNGGEITPELDIKQKSINGLMESIIKNGTDEIISSKSIIDGKITTLKEMKSNISASIKSFEMMLERIKFSAGALFAKSDINKIKGNLGSISIKDVRILKIINKELIENDFKWVVIYYDKKEYEEKEYELAAIAKEVKKKEEINETKLKNSYGSKGAEIKEKKTIVIYKKRTKKET